MILIRASTRVRHVTSEAVRNIREVPTSGSRCRSLYTNNSFLKVSEEVQHALQTKRPVVALETTIYTHGWQYPDNAALASHLESIVRMNGGVPATIGILDGVARVGFAPEELNRLAASAGKPETLKVSRRDLGYICGLVITTEFTLCLLIV